MDRCGLIQKKYMYCVYVCINVRQNLHIPGVAIKTRDTTTCAMAFLAAAADWPMRSPSSVNTGMPCISSLE